MDTCSNAQSARNQQLELFDTGTTLTELAVDALKGDPEAIRGAAQALVVLVKYHAAKTPGVVR